MNLFSPQVPARSSTDSGSHCEPRKILSWCGEIDAETINTGPSSTSATACAARASSAPIKGTTMLVKAQTMHEVQGIICEKC